MKSGAPIAGTDKLSVRIAGRVTRFYLYRANIKYNEYGVGTLDASRYHYVLPFRTFSSTFQRHCERLKECKRFSKTGINFLANFEALIRSALAQRDAAELQVREKVYQSSRNALQRMIESNRSLTVEAALVQRRALEEAIQRIETEITNPPPPPVSTPLTASSPTLDPVPDQIDPPLMATRDDVPGTGGDFAPSVDLDDLSEDVHLEEMVSFSQPHEFSERRKWQRKLLGIIAIVFILAFLLWLMSILFSDSIESFLSGSSRNSSQINSLDPTEGQEENLDYITILEASDPSALVTAGSGSAEIVNELNAEMLRIVSLRQEGQWQDAAAPIKLTLKPGVQERIAGQKITVEIYAKSGGNGPAAFTVACKLGELGSCGRKRFRVGLQPEAAVFSIDTKAGPGKSDTAHLAISTDATGSAEVTGRGDAVDIIYVRLRLAE